MKINRANSIPQKSSVRQQKNRSIFHTLCILFITLPSGILTGAILTTIFQVFLQDLGQDEFVNHEMFLKGLRAYLFIWSFGILIVGTPIWAILHLCNFRSKTLFMGIGFCTPFLFSIAFFPEQIGIMHTVKSIFTGIAGLSSATLMWYLVYKH